MRWHHQGQCAEPRPKEPSTRQKRRKCTRTFARKAREKPCPDEDNDPGAIPHGLEQKVGHPRANRTRRIVHVARADTAKTRVAGGPCR